ncbi:PAP2 superfamily-domain-containing protein [Scheffersomyces xylosifermentans]|uniref:PAP2 superfamily-domain-containing protein n=1 Tax=Scheffersomyces xylosifermentans TaxID=1304137 RepID=UPI00315DC464
MPTYFPADVKYNPVPFDHTYILYDPKDVISIISVHCSLLPIYTMVFYTSWFLITREVEAVVVVGGHLVGEVLNKIVKKIIKQPRPDFHKDFGTGSYSLTYGMPSAHSQFMGFFAAYFICIIVFKVQHLSRNQRQAGCFVLVVASLLVAFSRVYLLYHTTQQVVVGVMFGVTLGLFYFIATTVARDVGLVDWVLQWPIVKYFYVKDSYFHNYQSFKDEYNMYLELSKAAKGTLVGKV